MLTDAALLKDLVTGASISLSPAVAWLTFVTSWRSKRRERLEMLRKRLFELQSELKIIGNWAQSEYDNASDNPRDWNNPFWRVLDFPSDRITTFNRETDPSEVGKPVSDAIVALEASIARFRTLLRQHARFVAEGSKTYGKPESANSERIIFQAPDEWYKELHRINREIHARGIGNAGLKEGLNATWREANTRLEKGLADLRQREGAKILWIGHILAIILGLIGLFFLAMFFFELWAQLNVPVGPDNTAYS